MEAAGEEARLDLHDLLVHLACMVFGLGGGGPGGGITVNGWMELFYFFYMYIRTYNIYLYILYI